MDLMRYGHQRRIGLHAIDLVQVQGDRASQTGMAGHLYE